MTKLTKENTTYYVVDSPDDGKLHDTHALRFDDLKEAKEFLYTEECDFRERQLMAEDQFLAEWSKPAEAYENEEEAAEDGYVWDDQLGRWLEIPVNDWDDPYAKMTEVPVDD